MLKKVMGAMKRWTKNTNYQGRAVEKVTKMSETGEKVPAPRHPSEEKHIEHAMRDENIRQVRGIREKRECLQEVNKRRDELIEKVNQMKITSTDPPERWTPSKDLPTHESEFLARHTPEWEFGFYEPPVDKIPRNRLTMREALVLLKAKSDLHASTAGTSQLAENAMRILEEHPAGKRLQQDVIDRLWRYFRPFEREDKKKVVRNEDLQELYQIMHGYGEDDLAQFGTAVRGWIDHERWAKLNEEERKQFVRAVREQREAEFLRLEARLKHLREDEETVRKEEQAKRIEAKQRKTKGDG